MKTTLNKIRAHSPCKPGWEKLLGSLGKTKADDAPVTIIQILNSSGLDDAIWCLRGVDGREKELRLLVVAYARRVQHLMIDARSIAALDVAERFANGAATELELTAAWDAALAAARAAARDPAGGAEGDAAWAAAQAAAQAAALAAALSAAWAAAGAAAGAAEKTWQEAELRRVCEACA